MEGGILHILAEIVCTQLTRISSSLAESTVVGMEVKKVTSLLFNTDMNGLPVSKHPATGLLACVKTVRGHKHVFDAEVKEDVDYVRSLLYLPTEHGDQSINQQSKINTDVQ